MSLIEGVTYNTQNIGGTYEVEICALHTYNKYVRIYSLYVRRITLYDGVQVIVRVNEESVVYCVVYYVCVYFTK